MAECTTKVHIWMMMNRPCNVIPSIMLLALNPPALKDKRFHVLMESLERSDAHQYKVQKGSRRGPNATFSNISPTGWRHRNYASKMATPQWLHTQKPEIWRFDKTGIHCAHPFQTSSNVRTNLCQEKAIKDVLDGFPCHRT